ncbi:MAG: prolyl oligopeptidase family serine peptidase [Hyphomicrobiales bacterium]|nr:prolyl oligopeptidase family serine peptidase [Hyphomicrobiales bacterium]
MRRAQFAALGVLMCALATAGPAGAGSLERVSMPAAGVPGGSLIGYVMRPDTPAPAGIKRPAVVALHGCGGVFRADGSQQARDEDWGRRLASQGFVVVFPDSFGSRNLGPQCTVKNRAILPRQRADDAIAAARWLASEPDVDAGRIALLGWSHGGSSTLWTVDARRTGDMPFKTAIAFYPGCRPFAEAAAWSSKIKLLLLMGAADDWTPPEPCRQIAARTNVRFIEYPGAYHGFDAPNSPVRVRTGLTFSADGSGRAHIGTDPAARAAAIEEVGRTLAAMLR